MMIASPFRQDLGEPSLFGEPIVVQIDALVGKDTEEVEAQQH